MWSISIPAVLLLLRLVMVLQKPRDAIANINITFSAAAAFSGVPIAVRCLVRLVHDPRVARRNVAVLLFQNAAAHACIASSLHTWKCRTCIASPIEATCEAMSMHVSKHHGTVPWMAVVDVGSFADITSPLLTAQCRRDVQDKEDIDGEEIAVKVLQERTGRNHDEAFQKEFYSLLELRHQNIILLVGYCYETEKRINNFTGKFDDIIRAALCFEYAPNENLRKYISDEHHQLDWHTSYKIIKGTCEGLRYLHHHPSGPIYHLDLKPENILLSGNMDPKIANFGMSRLFVDRTTNITRSAIGTWRYQPLEYKTGGTISKEFDIYSLGVIIIEMVVGPKTYDDFDNFSPPEVIELADEKWRQKLKKTETRQSLEAYCQQVKTCLEIALKCVENKRKERPTIIDIISQLNEVENKTPKRNSVFQVSRKDSGSSTEQQQYAPTSSSRSTGSDAKVVLYVTTMGGIAKTFNDCNTIRAALDSCGVDYIEKDLFGRTDHQKEVKKLLAGTSYKQQLPVLCINGVLFADARELLKLHEEGTLAALFK